MRTVYYLGFYDIDNNKNEKRNIVLSATNKMSYIIEAIDDCGYCADVISASYTLGEKKCPEKCIDIAKNSKLHLFKSLPWGNKFKRVKSYIYTYRQLYKYIVSNLKKDDILIVYHSMAYMSPVKKAKKKIGFELILEVEEIYNDVIKKSEKKREQEVNYFKLADKYIFPTELLNECVNKENKPYSVIHGTYRVERDRGGSFGDDKIHVLYAGTLDPRKGGAAAAAAAGFLPENYHVHILGFGGKTEIEYIKKLVSDVNKKTRATLTYDGLLSGDDYIEFIQKCNIGLSTQNPNADFNATSFPSKILSYMANGLRVVSVRIPAIEHSAIGEDMYYYNEQTPEEIAKAIMSVDLNDGYDGRAKIKQLDKSFREELKELLNK